MRTDTELIRAALASGDPKAIELATIIARDRLAKDAEVNFRSFVELFWPQVATTPLRPGWYLDAICDHLQNLPDIKRLLINIPPRHGKSTIVEVLYPAWLWLNRPNTKFLCSSFSLKLISERDSIACRSVIESPLYRQNWGDRFKLSKDQNTKNKFSNDKLGFRVATSCDSGNTGEGADVLLADDLNSVSKAHSEADRQSVIQWWCQVMSTRMNPGGLDCKCVIQQRCHEEDVTGYILAQEDADKWTRLVLPYEFDPSRRTVTSLPWKDPRTTEGEPLSDLLTPEKITELKGGNGLGPTGFACQFNQLPAPASGNVFHRSWFGRYDELPDAFVLGKDRIKKEICHRVVVTDLAISLKASADFTVAQTWAITPHNHLILLEQFRDKVEGPDAVKAFKRLNDKHRPDAVYVEDVAFQRLMIQLLRQSGLPVKALNHQGQDKKARCQRSLAKAECGQIWLPQGKMEWLQDWIDEVCTFPNARHDDVVDCLAWAGIVASKYPTNELPRFDAPDREALLRKAEEKFLCS